MKKPKPIETARSPDLRNSWPALLEAGRRARAIAASNGTPIVVERNGELEYVYPTRADVHAMEAREPLMSTDEFLARFAGCLGEDFPDNAGDEDWVRGSPGKGTP